MKELVRTIEEEVEKNSVEEAKVESMPIHREFMFEVALILCLYTYVN